MGHSGVNMVRLLAAELIRGYQDFVSMALVSLIPVVAIVDNTVDMLLIHKLKSPFLFYFWYFSILFCEQANYKIAHSLTFWYILKKIRFDNESLPCGFEILNKIKFAGMGCIDGINKLPGGVSVNKLYRSRRIRMIAGVAGGLAEYFEVDVTLVRLLWVLAVFAGGAGVLVYIAAVIIIPEEKDAPGYPTAEQDETVATPEKSPHRERNRRNAGLLLIGLGIVLLAHELLPWDLMRYSWPLLLIALGFFIIFRDRKGSG